MCNSVLCGHLARAAPLYDLNEQGGADVGKVLVGQILPWCGVHTKRMKELKKQDAGSIFRILSNPRCGGSWTRYWAFWARKSLSKKEEPMKERKWAWTSCCFSKSPCSLSARGFYVVDTLRNNHYPKRRWDHTSVMEGKVQDDTSNFGNFKHQCPEKFTNTYMKECKKT